VPPDRSLDLTRNQRPTCRRCHRPEAACYCAWITPLETTTRVVILQHPKERGMPIGTAHMAHLCLPNSVVHVGMQWDGSPALHEACNDAAKPPILLYPGEGARDILASPPPGPVTLIVVDGTWSQARNVVRDNPELAALPRYQFRAPAPSTYRIRREPDDAYVSTLEALMHVLGALEGNPARFRTMLDPMRAMVETQVAAEEAESNPRQARRRKRRSAYERLPADLRHALASFEDLVVVMGDANAWPHGTPERQHGDALVYWVAVRPADGSTLTAVIAPEGPLAPATPERSGLSAEALRAGMTGAAFLEALTSFWRPNDIVASWGHHALRLLQDSGGAIPGPYVDLRHAARLQTNRAPGLLENFAAREGLESEVSVDAPRAKRRVAVMTSLVRSWRDLQDPAPLPTHDDAPDRAPSG